jgi:hypothetical protein
MISKCPKCDKPVPEDAVYCPYCAYGLRPSARTNRTSIGGSLMLIAAATSFILLILSIEALLAIYQWYPQLTAQLWFSYDQALTIFSFVGFISGATASALSLARKSYKWTMLTAVVCTFAGAASWTVSMIIPYAAQWLWNSILYYFLPMFLAPLIGTVLIYPRRAEFKK